MSDETRNGVPGAGPGSRPKPTPAEVQEARREALRLKYTRRKLGISGRIGQAFDPIQIWCSGHIGRQKNGDDADHEQHA